LLSEKRKPKMSWSKYEKHYRKEWEKLVEFKGWLSEKGTLAHCKLCRADLRPQLADLRKHAKGKKHSELVSIKRLQPSVSSFKPLEDLPLSKKRRLEIRVALNCAVSTSFRSLDSLGSILEDELGRTGKFFAAVNYWFAIIIFCQAFIN